MSLSDERHVAKTWVEQHYPDANGSLKAMLILTYGAGLDRGLAEAIEMAEQAAEFITTGRVATP